MSVGFGFSAGDFISALELVGTVIDALRESGHSSAQYRSLISQLYTLETALLRVKRLELDGSQQGELVALREAALKCQGTIDAFWEKIKKYQPSLRTGGSRNGFRDGWRKVRWAVCKREDLAEFKADLMAHTNSIEILLMTVHMSATRIDGKKNDDNHRTLLGKVQDSYFSYVQGINSILQGVASGIQQGKHLIEMTSNIFRTNMQIFQMVLDIHKAMTRIPGQIERQQPVYFIDACGRRQPFHLEFILSKEAFISVLQSNFKQVVFAAGWIENGRFAIEDCATQKYVDMSLPWDAWFYPGQQVVMSITFHSSALCKSPCPRCFEKVGGLIEYQECRMGYDHCVTPVQFSQTSIFWLSPCRCARLKLDWWERQPVTTPQDIEPNAVHIPDAFYFGLMLSVCGI